MDVNASLADVIRGFDPASEFICPPNWYQGRTAFGGLSAALCLQAAVQASADLPALKAAQVAFIGPAAGPLRFKPQLLRAGKSTVLVQVDALAGGSLVIRCLFVFAAKRSSSISHDLIVRPDVMGPEHYYQLFSNDENTPAFLQNFDMRFTGGVHPVSGAAHPEFVAWMRHRDAAGVDPTVALVTMADGLPPAAMASFTRMAPVSSVTWSFDVLQPAPAGMWFLLRSSSRQALDGYSYQAMEIWDEAGGCVLAGSQSVALFT